MKKSLSVSGGEREEQRKAEDEREGKKKDYAESLEYLPSDANGATKICFHLLAL